MTTLVVLNYFDSTAEASSIVMNIDTEEFISAVQHCTAIWQSKYPQHLNRAVINKLWEEIKQLFPGSDG